MDIWGNNDEISTIDNTNVNTYKITKDFAYFLGLYISKGSVTKNHGINIVCSDDISNILNSLGYKFCNDGIHYTINSKTLCDILISLGFELDMLTNEKILPKLLFEMSRDNIIALIQGIMDSDGSSQKNRGTISIRLSSKRLVEQIRIILNNFGILSTFVHEISKPTKKVAVHSEYYGLELNKAMSKKYYDIIGFRFSRKQSNCYYIPDKIKRDSFDIIPYSKDIIMGLKYTNYDDYNKIVKHGIFEGNYKKNHHFSRQFMLKNKDEIGLCVHACMRLCLYVYIYQMNVWIQRW
jgi:intein/homing endonuclease